MARSAWTGSPPPPPPPSLAAAARGNGQREKRRLRLGWSSFRSQCGSIGEPVCLREAGFSVAPEKRADLLSRHAYPPSVPQRWRGERAGRGPRRRLSLCVKRHPGVMDKLYRSRLARIGALLCCAGLGLIVVGRYKEPRLTPSASSPASPPRFSHSYWRLSLRTRLRGGGPSNREKEFEKERRERADEIEEQRKKEVQRRLTQPREPGGVEDSLRRKGSQRRAAVSPATLVGRVDCQRREALGARERVRPHGKTRKPPTGASKNCGGGSATALRTTTTGWTS